MQYIFITTLITAISLFISDFSFAQNQKIATQPLITIIALGDSLTEGYGIDKNLAYPALLEKKLRADGLNIKILNSGISGSTSASALARLKWVLKSKPDILFLALGANDGLRGVDPKTTEKNLRDTIHLAKNNKLKVWLAGIKVPPNYGKSYAKNFEQIFPRLAQEEKIPLLPFLLEGVAGQPHLNQPDAIHPNEKGHALIADLVYKFMKGHL